MAEAVPKIDASLSPEARLELGRSLEERSQHGDALLAYYRAIIEAQRQGRWLDTGSTTPALKTAVAHAMRCVKAGRRFAFDQVLAPVFARHGRAALARFEACLATQIGERRVTPFDHRQQPSMLYFPGLPTEPYFERSLFPWIAGLERQTAAIREELLSILPRTAAAERVFGSDEAELRGLRGVDEAPSWNGFYFFRHGERRDGNHALCPRTSAALGSLPLVQIRGNAPEVMFSVLTPGSHILPHRGVTNVRSVCHLPLLVPANCALVVGGQPHAWREGEAFVFDDTYEHEAWNRGTGIRVMLIVDVWNPHLTEAEREAVAVLVAAVGDFNRAAGV